MGNFIPKESYPKEYLDAKQLSDEELIANIQKESDIEFNKIDFGTGGRKDMWIKSWNTQVYFERKRKSSDVAVWMEKEDYSVLFDKYNRVYYARFAHNNFPKQDAIHPKGVMGFWVIFLECPRCKTNTTH